jgi:hypothetical protein
LPGGDQALLPETKPAPFSITRKDEVRQSEGEIIMKARKVLILALLICGFIVICKYIVLPEG